MASSELSNEGRPSVNQSAARPNVSKPYRTPTLLKGPVLSGITAEPALSGSVLIVD
jgi:hypothetical protein